MNSHLLLAVAGKTPATITEALYGLAVERRLPISRIRVLTTQDGREAIVSDLAGQIAKMRHDYPKAFRELAFDPESDIAVCAGARGKPICDIRTSKENEQIADWILAEVYRLTQDSTLTIHASLAGGRKTMSHFLGTAMQLLGRSQDRLYHVLVPEEYERRGFYYPTPKDEWIAPPAGKRLSARAAKVDMAELPFVRLRQSLDEQTLNHLLRKPSMSIMVKRTENQLAGPRLELHIFWMRSPQNDKPRIEFREPGVQQPCVTLNFAKPDTLEFVIYSFLAARRLREAEVGREETPEPFPLTAWHGLGKSLVALQDWTEKDLISRGGWKDASEKSKLLEDIKLSLNEYKQARAEKKDVKQKPKITQEEPYKIWIGPLRERLSKLEKKIFNMFSHSVPEHPAESYLIQRHTHDQGYGDTGYGYLALSPSQIYFHPPMKDLRVPV
jgi:CRISPR-associated protein (TIGR02584 family)